MLKSRRALLFMPGDDRRKIEKGAALGRAEPGVDAVIMDFEDGAALNAKDSARAVTAAALRELDFGRAETWVRINPVSRDHFPEADLEAVLDARPDGIMIPKVEAAWHVAQVSERLTQAEQRNGWEAGSLAVIAIVESAVGLVNIRDTAENAPRLVGLAFGAEDYAGDVGAVRTAEGTEVLFARSSVVLHAKAFGLEALDTPYTNLTDEPGLIRDTTTALMLGFTGKLAIHPGQVTPIQNVFTPTPHQIDQALRLIRAHDAHQAQGTGVFAFEGSMVDMPMVRAAQTVIARARAAGIAASQE
ncbi:MAG: CoA ester lyase [bacterium]|nr:CoA ester lyase [bacterium]